MELRQKRPRLVLDVDGYQNLKEEVLRRDGWKCQECGMPANLEVHHILPRSYLGSDVADNLVTLCAACHGRVHKNIRY